MMVAYKESACCQPIKRVTDCFDGVEAAKHESSLGLTFYIFHAYHQSHNMEVPPD